MQNGSSLNQFNQPVTIDVKYPTNLTVDKDTLQLYWWDGGSWSTQGINLIARTDTSLTAQTDHFTLFAVLSAGGASEVYLPVVIK